MKEKFISHLKTLLFGKIRTEDIPAVVDKIMITETAYYPEDLRRGTCKCCGETSNEIVKGEDLCADCLEEIKFLELCSEAEYEMIPHMYEKD